MKPLRRNWPWVYSYKGADTVTRSLGHLLPNLRTYPTPFIQWEHGTRFGQFIGTFWIGQVLTEKPNRQFFIDIAETCGFDREAYLADFAPRRWPVVAGPERVVPSREANNRLSSVRVYDNSALQALHLDTPAVTHLTVVRCSSLVALDLRRRTSLQGVNVWGSTALRRLDVRGLTNLRSICVSADWSTDRLVSSPGAAFELDAKA
jgi:hypothetical protein